MEFVANIESKWGKLETVGHCMQNGKMPFVSEQARLNMLFLPEDINDLIAKVEKKFECRLPEQLIKFYTSFNGCRLFFNSLNVFGIQVHPSEQYQPFDLFVENNHILGSLKAKERKVCDLVFVSSIGGDYAFGFNRSNPSGIVGIRKGSLSAAVQCFDSFDVFFDHYYSKLLNEYGDDCRKKNPTRQFIGIPALEHQTNEIL